MAEIQYAPLSEHLAAIQVHGPDAEKFLQSQFSNDLSRLPRGEGQWSSYSTAKGRMIANFFLQREEAGLFLFLAADLAEEVGQRLRKFRLMAKAEIELSPLSLWGIWGKDLDPSALQSQLQAATGAAGTALVAALPWPQPAALLLLQDGTLLAPVAESAGANHATANDWWAAAIHAGTAFISAASTEQIIPQELNLEVLGGINFKKGCYPGQEIVARSHYLGALKRQCYLIHSDSALAPGQEIFAPSMGEQAVGLVINAAQQGSGSVALAVLRAANEQEPLHLGEVDGPSLHLGSLPYALPLSQQKLEN